jgi:membrane protease YdiL (CAAX protease family)
MSGVAAYLLVSFGIAWICWGALLADAALRAVALTALLLAGSFGPFVAAGVCSWAAGGMRGMVRFYARVLNLRMGWGVFTVAFALLPGAAIIAAYIYARQMGGGFAFQMGWADLPVAYLWLFILGGPVAEEFGWTYLADRLSERVNFLAGTFLLGLIWGFWHLPLFFLVVPGLLQHYIPFGLFLLFSLVNRVLFAWAYYRGGENLLSNLIFHNALNFSLSVVVIVPPVAAAEHLRLWYLTVLAAVAAALLWRLAPPVGVGRLFAGQEPPGAEA